MQIQCCEGRTDFQYNKYQKEKYLPILKLNIEKVLKTKKTVTFTATCAHPLKEGHQEATVATPLPWNEMRTYILRRADGGPPAGQHMGPWWYLAVRGCPISRVHSSKPRDLEPEDPYSKGSKVNFWKEGKMKRNKIVV